MLRKEKNPTTSVIVVTNGPDDTAGSTPKRISSERNQNAAKRCGRQHAHHGEADHQAEVADVEPCRRDRAHDHRESTSR